MFNVLEECVIDENDPDSVALDLSKNTWLFYAITFTYFNSLKVVELYISSRLRFSLVSFKTQAGNSQMNYKKD